MKSQKELKQLYGEDYVKSFEYQKPFRLAQLIKFIQLDNTLSVADFACGNGILMELIAPRVRSYVGIDFSEVFINAANEKKEKLAIDNAKFECSDIVEFCQQHPDTFDVGFAMDFSEHVYDDEWIKILSSIRSSIKPGGKFYLHTPNAEFFLEKMKSKNFIVEQFPEHIAVRTSEQNVFMLREAGFKTVYTRFVPHYNKILRVVHPLSFVPVIGKYFKARIFIEASL
jgi:2-polyprenyl-6-hydroxyphenyl methylase / 3-demethylubiquinone-9 3-methyltransferase